MNFQIIQFLNQNFPKFNPENEQDVVRAEKLLKVEMAISGKFSVSEVSDAVLFFKENGNYFSEILQNNKLITILAEKKPLFRYFPLNLDTIPKEKLTSFSELSSEALMETTHIAFQNGQWSFIEYLLKELNELFRVKEKDQLIELLLIKIGQLQSSLSNKKIMEIRKNYDFAISKDFYKLLSKVDEITFEKSLLKIFSVAIKLRLNNEEKKFVGKILLALSNFKSSDNKEFFDKAKVLGLIWQTTGNQTESSEPDFFTIVKIIGLILMIILAIIRMVH